MMQSDVHTIISSERGENMEQSAEVNTRNRKQKERVNKDDQSNSSKKPKEVKRVKHRRKVPD